jgi:hypothetical protein
MSGPAYVLYRDDLEQPKPMKRKQQRKIYRVDDSRERAKPLDEIPD